jgi:hypothetical protein
LSEGVVADELVDAGLHERAGGVDREPFERQYGELRLRSHDVRFRNRDERFEQAECRV